MIFKILFLVILAFNLNLANLGENLNLEEMKKQEIIPDVIPNLPKKVLQIKYPTGEEVKMGNTLTPILTKDMPEIIWEGESDKFYLFAMVDPDYMSRSIKKGEWVHWIVANIPGKDLTRGDLIIEYVSALPSKGSGLHRYIFLIYEQPQKLTIDEPKLDNKSANGRTNFKVQDFITKYNLQDPLYGNFFLCEYDEYVDTGYKALGTSS